MKLGLLLERKLRVFDFDDTIASTQSKIHAVFADGKKKSLTPAEYANYFPKRKKGDKFDYSDFKNHTFFGSAVSKIDNFVSKAKDIEGYLSQISESLADK